MKKATFLLFSLFSLTILCFDSAIGQKFPARDFPDLPGDQMIFSNNGPVAHKAGPEKYNIFPAFNISPKVLEYPEINFSFSGATWMGDINGDGNTDFGIVAGYTGDERTPNDAGDYTSKTALWYGQASPGYPEQLLYDAELHPIGDYNNDGYDDAFNLLDGYLYYGSAAGIQENSLLMNGYETARDILPAGDLDGDARDDFFLIDYDLKYCCSSSPGVLGSYPQFAGWFLYESKIITGDADMDNRNEAVILSSTLDSIYFYKYSLVEGWVLISQVYANLDYYDIDYPVVYEDFNGDGLPDLVINRYDNSNDTYKLMVYHGMYNSPPYLSSQPYIYVFGANDSWVAGCGDLNKDGYADLAGNTSDGDLRILFGNPSKAKGFSQQILPVPASVKMFFNASNVYGDRNNDGYNDILLGKYGYDEHGRMVEPGANVLYGSNNITAGFTELILQDYEGFAYQDQFGLTTANLGDVNGDGYPDWGITAWWGKYVQIFFGGETLDGEADVQILFPQDNETGQVIYHLTGCDINGDGLSDVILSFTSYDIPEESYVYIYEGRNDWPQKLYPEDASQAIPNPSAITYFGYFISGVSDFNADGYNDFVVSGLRYPVDGSQYFKREAYLYYGGENFPSQPSLTLWMPQQEYSTYFAYRISDCGDLNNDGYYDFALSDRRHQNPNGSTGQVLVYFGGPQADNQADLIIDAPDENQYYFGIAMSTNMGDYDGDGYVDLAVGTYYNFLNEGSEIYIFKGGPLLDGNYDYIIQDPEYFSYGLYGNLSFMYEFSHAGKYDLLVYSFLFDNHSLVFSGEAANQTEADYLLYLPNYSSPGGSNYRAAVGNFNKNNKLDIVLAQDEDFNLGYGTGMGYFFESPFAVTSGIEEDIPDSPGLTLEVIPNPFTDIVSISIHSSSKTSVEMAFYDMMMHPVSTPVTVELEPGDNSSQINLDHLANGVYICKIMQKESWQYRTVKLVKR